MKPSFLVTVVRHGETYMNSQRLLQGHSDAPLSEVGMEQARQLGRSISSTLFTSAYASDLQRAFNTAKCILGELSTSTPEIKKDPRLRERSYGDAEGKPVQEFLQRAADANLGVTDFVPNGAETTSEVGKRVGEFFDDICKLSENSNSNENILVVSHGGWISVLMRHLNEKSDKYELHNFSPAKAMRIHHNTGITIFSINPSDCEPKKFMVDFIKVNDNCHLE